MKSLKVFFSLVVIFLMFSGCITQQTGTTPGMAPDSSVSVTQPGTAAESHWIRIDPVPDFQTDSSFTIIGSTSLNISGITDFPTGTVLNLYIFNSDTDRFLLKTSVTASKNESGPNSFSYTFDMKGNPPGSYRIILTDNINYITTEEDFRVLSESPYYKSIRIDFVGPVSIGKDLHISGTTDMPEGTHIAVETQVFFHPCMIPTIADTGGQKTLCGGGCGTGITRQEIPVTSGNGTVNIWNATVKTDNWCPTEGYQITASAINWTNVTSPWTIVR